MKLTLQIQLMPTAEQAVVAALASPTCLTVQVVSKDQIQVLQQLVTAENSDADFREAIAAAADWMVGAAQFTASATAGDPA